MMHGTHLADEVAARLEAEIRTLPDGFFDTFDYTTTGRNLTHPIGIGILAGIVRQLPGVVFVGVDVRFNEGDGVKFQPDVVGFDERLNPVVFVDYESPNSSDARIPTKDVDPYLAWRKARGLPVPYLVITTLPDRECQGWELRYTSPGCYNFSVRGQQGDVARNPCQFWLPIIASQLSERQATDVAIVNVSGRQVQRVLPA